jgi:hypothetical protein
MTIERDLPGIGPNPIGRADPGPTTAAGPERAEFRRLLERLEKLARPDRSAEVKDADGLQEALRGADDGFVSAMDLRRKLEEAFRARSS